MREVSLMFVGCGRVGQALLDHLKRYDAPAHGLRFSVAATVRSRTIDFPISGCRLTRQPGEWDDVVEVARGLRAERHDLVIIDASDAETAPLHLMLVQDGFTVVTADKKPLVGPFADYQALTTAIDPRGHRSYWFEATVGGGLPVVRTIRELIETGDTITGIEAVMSGTLNYLCEAHAARRPFGEAVLEAYGLGLTEPDPRDDLLCHDVRRKAVIIDRLAAVPDVTPSVAPLIDQADADIDLAAFMDGLKTRERWPSAWPDPGTECEYVFKTGPIASPTPTAALVSRNKNRPALSGPENRFVIYTTRNGKVPILIRGPGAGAAITATAVFGDLLRSLARL